VKNKIAPVLAVLTLIFALGVGASFAGIFMWNDTNGNWAADSNWQGASAPSGANNTDVLNFGDTQGTSYTAANDLTTVPAVINEIAGNSSSHQINLTGNQVQLAGTTPELAQNGSGVLNVQNDLDLAANTTLGGSGSGGVILGGVISGSSAGLTKTTTGVATLTGSSTYGGGTVVNAGTLVVNNSGAGSSGTGTGSVTVNGATVQGSGTISGAVTVNSGGTLKGTLTTGALTVNAGGDISPGNSPGTLNVGNTTLNSGGKYTFEVNDFSGTAGNDPGWDLLNIAGTLALGGIAPSNPFLIQLDSLTGSVPGLAANFNQYGDYSLLIATASGGISGFQSDLFTIDTTGFQNANNGFWTVSDAGGESLDLNYTAVPEPSMAMLWLSGCGIFALRFLLRRHSTVKAGAI
jgi:autotransporter-associated beta strand protein